MTKKITTYDRFMESLNPEERRDYEKEYRNLLFSELLISLMQDDEISVRKLADLAGISPTVIQSIRSGKKKNITIETLIRLIDAFGYSLIIEKPLKVVTKIKGLDKNRIVLHHANQEHSPREAARKR